MHLLLTGDLHIGRSSSGVATAQAGLRAADAWDRIVDLALERSVVAVVISGDVVDQSNRFFEATGPLSRGLRRLALKGIRTLAVAGNHDHGVLRALAQQYAGQEYNFQLLGRNGAWEEAVIEFQGRPAMRIVGWSFPNESHRNDPLDTFPQQLSQDLPLIGLVHGDLDVKGSPYAPLSGERLKKQPVAGWLLGHIHAPRLRQDPGCPWILYPGSPQALDPGEPGVHGAWVAEVLPSSIHAPVQIPLSSVRYEYITVDVNEAVNETDLRVRLRDELRSRAEDCRTESGGSLKALVADLIVEGMTPAADKVELILGELQEAQDLDTSVAVEVRKFSCRATRPLDIAALAQGKSLPGVLARLVQDLESGRDSQAVGEVMGRAMKSVGELPLASWVKRGDSESRLEFSNQAVRGSVEAAARNLLAGLLAAGPADTEGGRA
ncbi:MAG: DNA repair exonuclease [Chthoniobacter sp.]|nr:DNA repair exonuclease [Chthoniobacter sp.]